MKKASSSICDTEKYFQMQELKGVLKNYFNDE